MEGKLIKGKTGYWLDDINGNLIASVTFKGVSDWKDKFLLSLKNCQAIENGYDLDELYEKVVNSDFSDKYEDGVHYYSFIEGFQKALEILCDKKFSEKDVINAFHVGRLYQGREGDTTIENYLQSLQQTEWDVEICCYIGNGDKESDSFKDPLVTNTGIPKLNEDGCLILKRV